jgi:hypothetical protein
MFEPFKIVMRDTMAKTRSVWKIFKSKSKETKEDIAHELGYPSQDSLHASIRDTMYHSHRSSAQTRETPSQKYRKK